MTAEPINMFWSSWDRYTIEQLEEHGLVPSDQIEEFTYDEPYPTDGPVPCDACGGQGCRVSKRYEADENYQITWCYGCNGTTERNFLCTCGSEAYVTNARLTKDLPELIVQHKQWCMLNERCMTMISAGARTCCRPIVARFDIHHDGKMWGYCGVHSRGKQEEEERNARWALNQLESEWQQDVDLKKEATVEDRIAAIRQKLGVMSNEQFAYRIRYDGQVHVTISLEMLENYVGVEAPAEAEDLASLVGFEAGDGPEPF